MRCRHCKTTLVRDLIDLGFAPPSNAYRVSEDFGKPELYYPLNVKICEECWLVQTMDYTEAGDLFNSDYSYFSSTSRSWLAHAKAYVETMVCQLGLNSNSHVIEVASNDGYLLRNLVERNIPCLGIEPTESTALVAEKLGIPVLRRFFGEELGRELKQGGLQGDLIVGNNVFAHVPDINDFTRGLKAALKPNGTITLEFPHLLKLIEFTQFDTIYHEHFSYLSLYTVDRIFSLMGLRIWNVEELQTHGGSLRVYGCHCDDARETSASVSSMLEKERVKGLQSIDTYLTFQQKAEQVKDNLILFLIEQKRLGKSVVAYGAAAKGNTLLNFAGVKPDLIPFVCDAAVAKQNKFLPGSHIPVVSPSKLLELEPEYVLILPWNLASEVKEQLSHLRDHGTRFVTFIPQIEIS